MKLLLQHFKSGARHEVYSGDENGWVVTVSVPIEQLSYEEAPKQIAVNVEIEKPVAGKPN